MKQVMRFLTPLAVAIMLLLLILVTALLIPTAGPVQAAPLLTRTAITPTVVSVAGVTRTLTTANADGNSFTNNGATWVEIANDYTATITATFVTPREVDGLPVEDKAIPIIAGSAQLIGPFSKDTFNQSDGTVQVNYTEVTSVTVGAFRLK